MVKRQANPDNKKNEQPKLNGSRQQGAAAVRSPVGCTPYKTTPQEPFLSWCTRERILYPACVIRELPLTGRAVVAFRDILMHEVVVEVPDASVLMVENCGIADILEGTRKRLRLYRMYLPGMSYVSQGQQRKCHVSWICAVCSCMALGCVRV